ncbi:hypothetical protein [Oryzomonas sagensis]|nr:hypothetical protein [Oryzomonas sagensis]
MAARRRAMPVVSCTPAPRPLPAGMPLFPSVVNPTTALAAPGTHGHTD